MRKEKVANSKISGYGWAVPKMVGVNLGIRFLLHKAAMSLERDASVSHFIIHQIFLLARDWS